MNNDGNEDDDIDENDAEVTVDDHVYVDDDREDNNEQCDQTNDTMMRMTLIQIDF